MALVGATKFSLPKFPPAGSAYSFSNEQAFRRAIELALNGIFVATNDQVSKTLSLGLLGWTHTLTFSAVDHNTVQWTSGSIILPNGTTYAIDAGDTGTMTTVTYIYLDLAVSETALQTTTTASNAVGPNRILIAVANDVEEGKDARFQVMGGADHGDLELITADVIAANTITANELAANTITANEIAAGTITADRLSISTLSAITADMGSITAGSIVIGSTNKIWLNDSGDGALAIGGSTKASAPFRVSAAGELTATGATITGTIEAGSVVAAESFTAENPVFTGRITIEDGAGAPRVDIKSTTAGGGGGEIDLYDSNGDFGGFISGQAGGVLHLSGDQSAGGGVRIDNGVGGSNGTPIRGVYSATTTWNPGSIAPGDDATTTVTVNGCQVGDAVFVTNEFTQDDTNLVLSGRVSMGNTVTLHLHNTGGGAINPDSRTVRVVVIGF